MKIHLKVIGAMLLINSVVATPPQYGGDENPLMEFLLTTNNAPGCGADQTIHTYVFNEDTLSSCKSPKKFETYQDFIQAFNGGKLWGCTELSLKVGEDKGCESENPHNEIFINVQPNPEDVAQVIDEAYKKLASLTSLKILELNFGYTPDSQGGIERTMRRLNRINELTKLERLTLTSATPFLETVEVRLDTLSFLKTNISVTLDALPNLYSLDIKKLPGLGTSNIEWDMHATEMISYLKDSFNIHNLKVLAINWDTLYRLYSDEQYFNNKLKKLDQLDLFIPYFSTFGHRERVWRALQSIMTVCQENATLKVQFSYNKPYSKDSDVMGQLNEICYEKLQLSCQDLFAFSEVKIAFHEIASPKEAVEPARKKRRLNMDKS